MKNVTIYNATLKFRNFSGKGGDFNPEGRRNFNVELSPELAKELQEKGLRVRTLKPKDPDDEELFILPIQVSYAIDPPKITIVSKRGKTILEEGGIHILDWAEIENADLTFKPSYYNKHGREGYTAYLKSLYVTIVEDELDEKYYDVPDSAVDTIGGCGHCDECDGSCGCNHGN